MPVCGPFCLEGDRAGPSEPDPGPRHQEGGATGQGVVTGSETLGLFCFWALDAGSGYGKFERSLSGQWPRGKLF